MSVRKLQLPDSDNLETLRALCRYETHGGYVWAGVMSDGELLCVPCLRSKYRQVFRATRDADDSGFGLVGHANSGESSETEYCAHCNAPCMGARRGVSAVVTYAQRDWILRITDRYNTLLARIWEYLTWPM